MRPQKGNNTVISRDTFIPTALVSLVFCVALALVLAGHRSRVNERLPRIRFHPELVECIVNNHDAAAGRSLSVSASLSLSGKKGLSGKIERVAFWILLESGSPETAAIAFLQNGSFERGSQRIRGIHQMADVVFGAKTEKMSDAEIGLYCHWAANGQRSWGPDDLIEARRGVIDRMFKRGVISSGERDSLNSKSLALRPTPVPIN